MTGVRTHKDKVKLVPEHAMKACVGVVIYLHIFLTSALDGVE
jgi:hypothetical protein